MMLLQTKQNHISSISKVSSSQKGFTLIETLVAVFILALSITALLNVVGSSIFTSGYIKNKAIATGLAVEGVELVRNIQDSLLLAGGYGEDSPINVILGDIGGLQYCFSLSGTCFIDPLTLDVSACQDGECPNLRLSSNGYYNYTEGEETQFVRSIRINQTGPDSAHVVVRVGWLQGQTEREVLYETDIFLWIQ